MKSAITPRALSHLYLHAVLPSLAELVQHDAEARSFIASWDLRLSIGVMGDQGVVLQIRKGEITSFSESKSKSEIRFLFLNHKHLNAFFNGNKWVPPLVTRGLWRFNVLKSFALLTERLSSILNDSSSTSPLYTRLVFLIGGLGILPLVTFDPFSQAILKKIPQGLAQFSIGDETIAPLWFDHQYDQSVAGTGKPPRTPDVSVQFSDMTIANAALRNDIDTMAAIGAQRIIVQGLSPLAEGLGLIMERLNVYLAR